MCRLLQRFYNVTNKYGNEENILMGETRSTLIQTVFDFPRESKRGAIKYEREEEEEKGGEWSNDWPKEANNPRGISLFTSREMRARIKIANTIFKIYHPSLFAHPAWRTSFPWENAGPPENFRSEFSSHAFSRCILSREFSRRGLPRCIFFSSARIVSVSQISRYALSVPLPLLEHVSAFFVVHFLVTNFLSSCIFPSYLSTHFPSPPNTFVSRLSRYTPVYFPCFLASSRFFSSSAPPSQPFSLFVFQSQFSLISLLHIFVPNTISIVNLLMNPL